MADANTIRVFIVDDHPIVREGLAQLINQEEDLTVCGDAGDAATAISALGACAPDIAIVDISLGDVSGLQLVKDITSKYKKMAVLVLSMHDDRVYAERALRAGAKGYIMKQEATQKVVSAIRKIVSGGVYLSDESAARMMHSFVGGEEAGGALPEDVLSDRELEVFQLIGQGFKSREISSKLNLSVKTIETYREHIKDKLSLEDATELVRYAIQWVHARPTK